MINPFGLFKPARKSFWTVSIGEMLHCRALGLHSMVSKNSRKGLFKRLRIPAHVHTHNQRTPGNCVAHVHFWWQARVVCQRMIGEFDTPSQRRPLPACLSSLTCRCWGRRSQKNALSHCNGGLRRLRQAGSQETMERLRGSAAIAGLCPFPEGVIAAGWGETLCGQQKYDMCLGRQRGHRRR